ncbi:MAG: redox-sensing transcriptional repressor Rex, partial [Clostridia bacterium]|nr:redox-sensing transcriptional repressor Rex [Clostridia bacterium]
MKKEAFDNGKTPLHATAGRLPVYLDYLKKCRSEGAKTISAPYIARSLGRGEVQVRKDLSSVSSCGKPKVGFDIDRLIADIEKQLGPGSHESAVIVGCGRLGSALLAFEGFAPYGVEVVAAFDEKFGSASEDEQGKKLLPMSELAGFIAKNGIKIGIITVPAKSAQQVCNELVACGVNAIWNFAPKVLAVPEEVTLRQENLALS